MKRSKRSVRNAVGCDSVKRACASVASGAACLLLTGCLVMPIPHKEWLAPPASGRVVDGQTGRPVSGAQVLRVEPSVASAQTRTDSNGRFELEGVKKVRWFYADRLARARYSFAAAGYEPCGTNKAGWPASRKDLRHDLREISLQPHQ